MEKENIYSTSLDHGKDAVFFGKWTKKNGTFIQLKRDSWHEDTQYWIPANIPDNGNMQWQVIDELVMSSAYKSFELIDLTTILMPVAEIGNLIILLSKKYANDNDVCEFINSIDLKGSDMLGNFEWQSVNEQNLQQYSSMIEPLDQPFRELQEEVHYRGGDSLKLVNQKVNVFFLPVTFFKFKINSQIFNWVYIVDDKSKLRVDTYQTDTETSHYIYLTSKSLPRNPIKIDIDKIFTLDENSQPNFVGCISQLGLFAVGIVLIVFIWPKLRGGMLLICIIGIVLLLKLLNNLIIEVAKRLAYRNRESKKQKIIERRKDFLAKKVLTG